MRIVKMIITALIPLTLVAAGMAGMQWLAAMKTPPEKKARKNPGALVETMTVRLQSRPVTIWATGTVQPRRRAEIAPQVSGQIVRVAPGFIAGGFFKKGDLLFQIEAVDYALAAEKSLAAVARARLELAEMESKARVARIEWERIRTEKKHPPNPLVLCEPQLENARAALASARADLKQRRIDIQRTKILAPFNCRIRSETIDPGQFITAGKTVAVVCGTDRAEVVVPVPFADLAWLFVPRNRNGKAAGSPAVARLAVAGRTISWQGRISRALGEVAPMGRMARLVVEVPDPFGFGPESNAKSLYLDQGLFVEVSMEGKLAENIAAIPTGALRQNSTAWIMNDQHLLEFRKVQRVRREKETVLVRGLCNGEKLVLTYLAGAAPGMKLRPMEGK